MSVKPRCGWCGRAFSKRSRVRRYRYADGTSELLHASCYHRKTAGDCFCDVCTGDIH